MPSHAATAEEIKDVIEVEGSFSLQKLQAFKMDWDTYMKKANPGLDKKARAEYLALSIPGSFLITLSTLFTLPMLSCGSPRRDNVIEVEGSSSLHRLEVFKMDWDTDTKKANPDPDKKARAAIIATDIRAVVKPILEKVSRMIYFVGLFKVAFFLVAIGWGTSICKLRPLGKETHVLHRLLLLTGMAL
ncbi:hypothetical protein GH714_030060 [Hevea brasiliensis]|uniref:Uncharacterized protein n=1 Tax=Hevea brasiliensis TaxID=3981 RepID=A0A6A6LQH2_HEVBR|nr:hypothetical protein GH714_030060 [Hevea brasiliensis]